MPPPSTCSATSPAGSATPACSWWRPSAPRTPRSAARLADRTTLVRLGALPRSAVDALAAASGLAAHGEQVMARTAGHPLSVVEYLRALGQGDTGVPESLADAVLGRVARLGAEGRAVVEAAAVLRRRIDPALVGALVESSDVATARECEELVRLRLLVRSGHHYEFANDLLQECVHAALPPALALALHRRAADLTSDRPEVMAEHAYAAGDEPRAAHGWLLAGEDALRRAAVEDALGLLDRCRRRGDRLRRDSGPCPAGARCGPRGAHGLRHRVGRRRRCAGPRAEHRRPAARDGRAPLPGWGRGRGARSHRRRDRRPAGARAPPGRGPRRPARGGGLHQPVGDPRGQPAAAGHGPRPGRGRPGASEVGGLGGRAGAGPRRPQDRVVLPRRPGPARRGDRRPRAPAARPRRHVAAAVDRVREVVRARGRGPSGRGPGGGRRGAGAQPAERLPRLRQLPAGPRRLVRPACRRPGGGTASRPRGRRGELAGRPSLVVRHRRRPARRHASRDRRSRRGRGRRAAGAGHQRAGDGAVGACVAWLRSPSRRATRAWWERPGARWTPSTARPATPG